MLRTKIDDDDAAARRKMAEMVGQYIEKRNLSLQEFGAMIGTTEGYVWKLRQGLSYPGPGKQLRMRKIGFNFNKIFDTALQEGSNSE